MAEVDPRWEWRTFAGAVPRADVVFDALTPVSVEEGDEVYLLARGGDNVKVRGGLMDVKVLRDTDAAGLQRWEPILKATFPLDAEAVSTVLQGLRRPAAAVPPDGLDFDGLLDAAGSDAGEGPRAVRVHKRRARYTVAGCLAERTVVEAGGHRTITIAAESVRPTDVLAAIDALGLRDYCQPGRPGRPAAARRSGAGALRRHRLRHELDQAAHRRARRRRARSVADRRRSGCGHPARRGTRGDRGDRRRPTRADRASDQRDGGRGSRPRRSCHRARRHGRSPDGWQPERGRRGGSGSVRAVPRRHLRGGRGQAGLPRRRHRRGPRRRARSWRSTRVAAARSSLSAMGRRSTNGSASTSAPSGSPSSSGWPRPCRATSWPRLWRPSLPSSPVSTGDHGRTGSWPWVAP